MKRQDNSENRKTLTRVPDHALVIFNQPVPSENKYTVISRCQPGYIDLIADWHWYHDSRYRITG